MGALAYILPFAIGLYHAQASLDPVDCYQRGLFCLPGMFDLILYFLGAIGLALSMVWGLCARARVEHWGGRIAAAGIALQVAPLIVYAAATAGLGARRAQVVDRHFKEMEHPKTWAIRDVLVQPDGKLVLLGSGLVRLLPDGQRDHSFHRDYAVARGGSLPNAIRGYWPEGACAAMAPNGDLILAANGWIGRVRPDGSDGPDLLKRSDGGACWGLAVQPDGKILAGWNSRGKSPISRLLPDGRVDPGFHPAFAPAPGPDHGQWSSRERIVVLRDGRIVLVGPMELVEGGCIRTLLRLNEDGSLDKGFRPGEPCQPAALAERDVPELLAVFPDGSMLVRMTNRDHASSDTIYLNPDGKEIRRSGLLHSLNHPSVTAVVPLNDGGILLGDLSGVARVRPDGTPDPAFQASDIELGALKIVLQGGKILVLAGNGKLVRLNEDGSPDPSFQTPAFEVYSD